MVYETFWGKITNEKNAEMADLNAREIGLLIPLFVLMIVMGFAPNPFLQKSEPAVRDLLQHVESKRIAAENLQLSESAVVDAAVEEPRNQIK